MRHKQRLKLLPAAIAVTFWLSAATARESAQSADSVIAVSVAPAAYGMKPLPPNTDACTAPKSIGGAAGDDMKGCVSSPHEPADSLVYAFMFPGTGSGAYGLPLFYGFPLDQDADARPIAMVGSEGTGEAPGGARAAPGAAGDLAHGTSTGEPETLHLLIAGIGLMLVVVWRRIEGG